MRRRAAVVVQVMLWLAALAASAMAHEIAALAGRAQRASVGLSCRGPAGRYFGTGTIIRPDGIILTSSTVLPPGASDIQVALADGQILRGTLITVDECVQAFVAGQTKVVASWRCAIPPH